MHETRTISIEVCLDPTDWSDHLADETRRGLAARPPSIPPVWFYDEHGSHLFDRITRVAEYYPTRAERSILTARADEIAAITGADTLIELGSGTSEKTWLLIDALRSAGTLRRIAPFDVSEEMLWSSCRTMAERLPGIDVAAVVGDFHRHLGNIPAGGTRLMAFLGSTIGNLDPDERRRFLGEVWAALRPAGSTTGRGDWFLLGTDLIKSRDRLEAAYDDTDGITAQFNLNCLRVMNRELGADFDLDAFHHEAHWNEERSLMEMRLVADSAQLVSIEGLDNATVRLDAGEWIRTEISTKFTREGITAELQAAGLEVHEQWTDPEGDFLLTLARPEV